MTPEQRLEELQVAYTKLADEAESFRLEAAATTRELLDIIDKQRATLEDAAAIAAATAAMRASNTGRLLAATAQLRARVRNWRMARRAAAARRHAATRTLRVPDAVTTAPIGVNVSGYLNAESGMGEAARCAVRALHAAEIPTALNNVVGPQRTADTSLGGFTSDHPHPFNLIHLNADNMEWVRQLRGPDYFIDRYTIGYWFWELEQFRPDWISAFSLVDEVWVATEFTRACMAADASVPVVHMPLGISAPVPGPFGRDHFGLPTQPFIFLYTFDVSSQTERKNPMAAIRAFRLAGFEHDEAVLLLKFTNGHSDRAAVRRLHEAASGLRVIFLDGALTRPEVNALMACTDACLSLHRAEGYGMTIAEQMLLGKPAIATAYSGNMDFMTPEVSCLVPAAMTSLTQDYGPYLKGYRWAEPSVTEAARHMQTLVRTDGVAAKLGAAGRAHVATMLDPARTSRLMAARLAQIQRRQTRITGHPPAPTATDQSFA
jgi:glycosyltransferase involved in cell wall biosynthesis